MFRRAQFVLGLAALAGVAFASASAGQGPPGGSLPGLDKAIAAKQKHADEMLDKPGVAGIGVGLNPAGKPVIEIYKEKADVADIPVELDGVPTAQVTTGVIEPRAPTDRFPRPVPIGVSSGLSGVATGTLGARVTDGTNTYALSNNHVFAGVNTASIGDPIIQPGDVDGGSDPADRIATLAAYQTIDFNGGTNTMDAAIALTSTANVGTATPADGYGAPSPVTASASIGLPVQKYGRTTGLQLGDVAATNVSVDVCYIAFGDFCLQEARFAGQISISPGPFSAPGDSGSLVVTQGANQPVGLLFAGGDGLTIATPIDVVLQRFGVTIDGAPPENGPPGPPIGLSATPGDGAVSLSWTAPSFDGGAPVSGYRVYRGTSPGGETFHQALGNVTSFVDTGLLNGTTFYYKVSAENDNGVGTLSSEVVATPTALVTPEEPLPILDDFNRGFENPLSDAGRWSNGVAGSGESGLYIPSTWVGCSKSTTCTSWRNAAQYGPDVEVWARVSVLTGDNNHVRLLARLQGVGTSTYDGYMLRTNQLPGTDQIWFERIDNGTFVTRLTVNQELVAGDILLLRAKGASFELWRNSSSVWTRLGVVTDSTYAAPGFVGIGLRGTTGRLDDFGARTMGVPPPDTEPPTAPGTLTANPLSSSQIDLSWGPATDNVAVTFYRVERCSGSGCSSFAEIASSTSTTHLDVGLDASTDYSYRVRAVDAADNEGLYSNTASATTPAPPDTQPPTAPAGLSATAAGPTRIDLSWTAATDNVAVTLYRIERCQGAGCSDFTELGTTASTSFASTGLAPLMSYSYRVRAQDAVPNLGPYSSTASATTPAPPDTEPPTAPTGPSATAAGPTQIDLSWTAATDNVAVTLYRIERCQGAGCSSFAEIGTTASTSYADTGLSASTAYSYRVRAQDAVPNVGPYSGTASATTQGGIATPVEPLPTVDSFNRANESPLRGFWSNGILGPVETGLRLRSNAIECTKTSTCTAWRNDASYGPDTEVWARVTTLPGTNNQFRLYARLQGAGSSAQTGYMLRTNQLAGTDQVLLDRLDGGTIVNRLTIPRELAVGDTILLRVKGTTLEAWLKHGTAWSLLGSVGDTTYAAAGRVGVGIRGKTGRLDDFGAR